MFTRLDELIGGGVSPPDQWQENFFDDGQLIEMLRTWF